MGETIKVNYEGREIEIEMYENGIASIADLKANNGHDQLYNDLKAINPQISCADAPTEEDKKMYGRFGMPLPVAYFIDAGQSTLLTLQALSELMEKNPAAFSQTENFAQVQAKVDSALGNVKIVDNVNLSYTTNQTQGYNKANDEGSAKITRTSFDKADTYTHLKRDIQQQIKAHLKEDHLSRIFVSSHKREIFKELNDTIAKLDNSDMNIQEKSIVLAGCLAKLIDNQNEYKKDHPRFSNNHDSKFSQRMGSVLEKYQDKIEINSAKQQYQALTNSSIQDVQQNLISQPGKGNR